MARPFPKAFVRDVLKQLGQVRGLKNALDRGIGSGDQGKRVQDLLLWEAERYSVDLREVYKTLNAKEPRRLEALKVRIEKHFRVIRLLRRYKRIRQLAIRREEEERRVPKQE